MRKFRKDFHPIFFISLIIIGVFFCPALSYSSQESMPALRVPMMDKYNRLVRGIEDVSSLISEQEKGAIVDKIAERANNNVVSDFDIESTLTAFIVNMTIDDLIVLFSKGKEFNASWAHIVRKWISEPKIIYFTDLEKVNILIENLKELSDGFFAKTLGEYLNLIKIAKGKNIEICSYVGRDVIEAVTDAIDKFPGELSKLQLDPVRFYASQLEGNTGGQARENFVTVDADKMWYDSGQIKNAVWHEILHSVSKYLCDNNIPIYPVFFWKSVARASGLRYAFIGGKLVPLDELPDTHKAFFKIRESDWVYVDKRGNKICYVSGEDVYGAYKKNSRYKNNHVVLKVANVKKYFEEYFKISPAEAIAVAGAKYIEDSEGAVDGTLKGMNPTLERIVDLLKDSLFIVRLDDGTFRRYVFGPGGEKPRMVLVSDEELDNMQGKFIADYNAPISRYGISHAINQFRSFSKSAGRSL